MASFSITNKTREIRPKIPYLSLKKAVLGAKYSLSVVFIESKESRQLNKIYRKKNKPADILSFPLSKDTGEIFIDLECAKKEVKKFERTFPKFIGFLFIHGLFHLKGMDHGAKMESAEKKIRVKFNI